MNKPISLQINELIRAGRLDEAIALATEAHEQYPQIAIYKQLADMCKSKISKSTNLNENSGIYPSGSNKDLKIDYETIEFHLRKRLEKIRSREISAIQAWHEISFLAPSHWPKDPRLSRIVSPSAKCLDMIRQQNESTILILSGDITGGAGIAALRVYECLNRIGQKSDIIFRERNALYLKNHNGQMIEIITEDLTSIIYEGFDLQLIEELRSHIWNEVHLTMSMKGQGSNTFLFHSEESLDIQELSRLYQGINIHWSDFLLTSVSLERIKHVDTPITITLHDMYWLNGSCHYSAGCTQFKSACTACPLVTRTSVSIGLFNQYHSTSLNSIKDLSVISPSLWLCDLARQSTSLSSRDAYFIFNPQVNKDNTRLDKESSRGQHPITIVYGALSLSEKRKGYALFLSVCEELWRRRCHIRFKVFGPLEAEQRKELEKYSCETLGFLSHKDLASLFSNADVLLMISHEDNYPNLCVEAAALGLPIIASNNSGLKSFIEVSEGGLLVNNHALEIADTISCLTKSKLAILSSKIIAWYQNSYNNTTLEQAYQSVILRKDDRGRYLFNATIQSSKLPQNQIKYCYEEFPEYVLEVSDFAIEVFVPVNIFMNDRYTLAYTLEAEGLQRPVIYIDGQLHEVQATANADRITYKVDNLPAGKPIKLIKCDTESSYYYKPLQVTSFDIYPSELGFNRARLPIEVRKIPQSNASGFRLIVVDDSIIIEKSNGSTVYWLLSNRRYALHLYKIPASNEQIELEQVSSGARSIIFHTFDLRHEPVSQTRMEVLTASESFYLMPTIEGDKFKFSIEEDLFYAMTSSFLITGVGERLPDGRDVVALINTHSTIVE